MRRLGAILREAYGLVVDDGRLAGAVLAWTALAGLAVRLGRLPRAVVAVAFALGLAAILVESVLRRARRGP